MKKDRIIYLFYCVIVIVIFTFVAEKTLRVLGYRPWKPWTRNVRVEPGGKYFTKDPLLGYTQLPGKFKVTVDDKYIFNATHLASTLRITHPLPSYDNISLKPEIWIFGCSFTYGWRLNDKETYPWILQEYLPNYEVVNFGVVGYGTLQALIQFKEAIKKKKPYLAIIAYASLHDERNTFLRKRMKIVAAYNKLGPLIQPYARLDYNNRLCFGVATAEYPEFPLMRHLSLVRWIEEKYDDIEDLFYRSHEVSKAIIKEISILCKEDNVELIVAGIVSDPKTMDMLNYCKSQGILTTDMAVDYSIDRNRLLDWHPSAVANKQIAEKLYIFLRNNVLKN